MSRKQKEELEDNKIIIGILESMVETERRHAKHWRDMANELTDTLRYVSKRVKIISKHCYTLKTDNDSINSKQDK